MSLKACTIKVLSVRLNTIKVLSVRLNTIKVLSVRLNTIKVLSVRLNNAWSSSLLSYESFGWTSNYTGSVVNQSHAIVSSSRSLSPCSPLGDLNMGQSQMMWLMICGLPHWNRFELAAPILWRNKALQPQPVLRWFSWTKSHEEDPSLGAWRKEGVKWWCAVPPRRYGWVWSNNLW